MKTRIVYHDIDDGREVHDAERPGVLFIAPVEMKEGDVVTLDFGTSRPVEISRNGKTIWSAANG